MQERNNNIRVDESGARYATVPMWQELPKIAVRLESGNTTYHFTASFDGRCSLPEKVMKLMDEEKSV